MIKKLKFFFFLMILLMAGCGQSSDDVQDDDGKNVVVKESRIDLICDVMESGCVEKSNEMEVLTEDRKNQTLKLNFFVEPCRTVELYSVRMVDDQLRVTVKEKGLRCYEGGEFVNLFVDFSTKKIKYKEIVSIKYIEAKENGKEDDDHGKYFGLYPVQEYGNEEVI